MAVSGLAFAFYLPSELWLILIMLSLLTLLDVPVVFCPCVYIYRVHPLLPAIFELRFLSSVCLGLC